MCFCFDINDIKSIGIKEWQENFFWPVTYEEYQGLYMKIWEAFEYVRDTEDKSIVDIMESCYKLAFDFTSIAHLHMVSERVNDIGMEHDINNILLNEIMEIRKFWSLDDKLNDNSFKNFLRSVKHSIMPNLSLGIYHLNGFVNSIGSFSSLKQAYLLKNKQFMIYKTPQSFIGEFNVSQYSVNNKVRIKTIVDTLIGRIMSNLASLEICLPKEMIDHFHSIALTTYLTFGALYEGVKKNISNRKRRDILAIGLGNAVNRTILIANSRTGGHSIGVGHGNTIGIKKDPLVNRTELSSVDEFLVPTNGAKHSLQLIMRQSEVLRNIKTQITSVHSDAYKKQWESNKSKAPPPEIKKVMYIGYPYTNYRYLGAPEDFAPIQIDLEHRVLSLLKGKYYVIYKAHPDTLIESNYGRIWTDLVDRIETRRFEEVYDDADAYIFGDPGTTTFGFTFLTKKRIIFFDTACDRYEEEAKSLMQKRAMTIKSWFDERNRLMFDEDQLLEALAKNPEEPNTEFIEKYMLP